MVEKIKVALVGLGNCFSGLIQGIEYYRKNPSQQVIGIIHEKLRDYSIHDIDFVAGFDVGENKIGKAVNDPLDYMNWLNVSTDYSKNFYEIVVVGKNAFQISKDLTSRYLPNTLVAASKTDADEYLIKNRYIKGNTLIYVCVNNSCKFPVETVDEALKLILN